MTIEPSEDKLKIISRSSEAFFDRVEAGGLLAEALGDYVTAQAVILGIPRGGLVVAQEVARRQNVPLDIVLSRKLGAPHDPELAIGAVTESGEMVLDRELADAVGAVKEYIEREKRSQQKEIERRSKIFRAVRPKIGLKDKDVILIDDGVATGSTVLAALWSLRHEGPRSIIVAFPVGPEDTLRKLSPSADRIICLRVPPVLGGVGQFYIHFGQVSDEHVISILRTAANLKS